MDSSGGFGRVMNESFTVALSPADDSWKNGTFYNVLANGMVFNRKWEAALVECHMPKLINLPQLFNKERFFNLGFSGIVLLEMLTARGVRLPQVRRLRKSTSTTPRIMKQTFTHSQRRFIKL